MNPPPLNEDRLQEATPEQIHSALFAQLVTGHAQMAMMFLGKYPHPQSGQIEKPAPEGAKMFIDQLEMLEAKTRGNLTAEESRLLKQMLSATRITFAEVIDVQLGTNEEAPANPPPAAEAAPAAGGTDPGPADDEGRVKFSKKY